MLAVVGPTAAGKSALALRLAEALGGEILTVDSAQVHRGLDIGTAKPSADERARVPHHLLDLVGPDQRLDAAAWASRADRAIAEVRARGRLPILCGGTGLWVRALLQGLSPIPEVPDAVRAEVAAELEARGPQAMHAELARVDPAVAARVAPADRQRIARALAVHRATGRALGEFQADHGFGAPRYAAQVYGFWPEREVLHRRIDRRVGEMLARGWVAEVEALLAGGLDPAAPGLQILGYRDVVEHLQGRVPASGLAARIAGSHRRYARRQLTWFRGIGQREHGLEQLGGDPDDALVTLRRAAAQGARTP
ncbi:MAG: tRNA (adenosine(37)-N6)-dimethylallyltransferase MiaA [Deltaproteobacteria bacterium]|nr:tRNA (adenosine(37)-N6)-dimethylallyltransferase MiaA [Deltaproteobacteria bacterium]MCB9788207.1 tRNA (adenosine(37)-N6)-dimethylallyltransferase MiaA [Deltaproteobacteria bacterium]